MSPAYWPMKWRSPPSCRQVDLVEHDHAPIPQHAARVQHVAEHVLGLKVQLDVVAEDEVRALVRHAAEVDSVEDLVGRVGPDTSAP